MVSKTCRVASDTLWALTQRRRGEHEWSNRVTSVLTEYADGIAVITINRPEARNAVNLDVAQRIAAAIDEFEARKDLTIAILTGAGGTFCAGMDLKAFSRGERDRKSVV